MAQYEKDTLEKRDDLNIVRSTKWNNSLRGPPVSTASSPMNVTITILLTSNDVLEIDEFF